MTIHKPLDEYDKFINFSRGLGSKYKALHTLMLRKLPYPISTYFLNSVRGFEMRKYTNYQVGQTHLDSNLAFVE